VVNITSDSGRLGRGKRWRHAGWGRLAARGERGGGREFERTAGGRNDFICVNDMAGLTLATLPFVASGAHATYHVLGTTLGHRTP
jgi:hypothetical protein